MKRVADAHHADCLARWAQPCIEKMRDAARICGYALAVHGSLAFDIDVIAVPWVVQAVPEADLIEALRKACESVTNLPTICGFADDTLAATYKMEPREQKLHGRVAWSWQLGGGVYVDCSVMPLRPDEEPGWVKRPEPPPEEQIEQELVDAGWSKLSPHMWKHPKNSFFFGPYQAWRVMKAGEV
jgi:hypothetical protein